MRWIRRLQGSAGLVAVLAIAAACGGGGAATATAVPTAALTAAASTAGASAPSSQTPTPTPATPAPATTPEATMTPKPTPFTLTSSVFKDGAALPRAITCDGDDRSPPLAWTGVPAGTKSLVLVVDDPDANGFTHWTVLDLPPDASGSLPAGVSPTSGAVEQGRNDFGKVGWGGPCPPSGTHHYRFTLSALAAPLGLGGHPNGAAVRVALRNAKVLGTARLTGTFHR